MHSRRQLRTVRWLLAWFTLSLFAAMVAPAMQSGDPHRDCPELAAMQPPADGHGTGHGDSTLAAQGHLHHCVLCGLVGGPSVAITLASYAPPRFAPQPACAAPSSVSSAAPLAARGPPRS